MSARTSRAKAAARKFNGFHWAAALCLLALAATSFITGWTDPLVGLNGVLIVASLSLLLYAVGWAAEKAAAKIARVSATLVTVAGVSGAAMLVATALRLGFGWITLAPAAAGLVGLVIGIVRARRGKAASPPHLRLTAVLYAVMAAMSAAAAIASPSLIGLVTQVAFVGSSICLGFALCGAGTDFVSQLRDTTAKRLPAVLIATGRVLMLFMLYTLSAAVPFALLTFVIGTLAS